MIKKLSEEQQTFVDQVAMAAKKYYTKYRILPSLTIAQAILESGWGKSRLAGECHNYFGMKWTKGCGCKCKEYNTGEQKPDGTRYVVKARFRSYDTMADGIKGYYDFLQYPRYKNLRGVKDYRVACKLIRSDGWATSLMYTEKLISLIETYGLDKYDKIAMK